MFRRKKDDAEKTLYCSFCGKSQHEVAKLIAGPTVFICDECTELCWDIVKNEYKWDLVRARNHEATPLHITNVLESSVAGHLRAKYILSLAVLDWLVAKSNERTDTSTDWSPHRMLLLGPIGSGKRLLAQAASSALGVPFAASTEKELGEKPAAEVWERIAQTLLEESEFNLEKATRGVVYLEINGPPPNSLAEFCEHRLITLSTVGTGLEGEVSPRFDLTRLLLIVGGPFLGLASTSGPIGRDEVARLGSQLDSHGCRDLAKVLGNVPRRAIIDYGLPGELADQFHYVAAMRDLYDGESGEDLGA